MITKTVLTNRRIKELEKLVSVVEVKRMNLREYDLVCDGCLIYTDIANLKNSGFSIVSVIIRDGKLIVRVFKDYTYDEALAGAILYE